MSRPPVDRAAMADVAALAARLRETPARLGATRLGCIDGPAGSGKTTLAGHLAEALGDGVAVLHMDDLYEGWTGLSTVWDRVEAQVLRPLERGESACWQQYDWSEARFTRWHDLAVPEVLLLEGCGSAPRAVDGRASLIVFVDAPANARLARGVARDGEHLRGEWLTWMGEEEVYLGQERTRARADVVIETGRQS